MNTDMIRPRECAQLLRLSVKTLAMHRCRGDGPPYYKLGGRILYSRADVQTWIELNAVEVPQSAPRPPTTPEPARESPKKKEKAGAASAAWLCLCGRVHAPHIHTCPGEKL